MKRRQASVLDVYLNTNLIGKLRRELNGGIEFKYTDEWREKGYSISLSLPISKQKFKGVEASFYFDNLLPDNENILNMIAQKFKAESIKQFDLLSAIGRECVGALSFFEEGSVPEFNNKITVKKLTSKQIEKKIQRLSTDNPLGMDDGDFRLSLGGAQEKMALLKRKNQWGEPTGMTPTTHIFKKKMGTLLGGIDFKLSVDNEHICLKLADFFGIDTCKSTIEEFESERVLCVERFDRVWKNDLLLRIPQEDFCQASGISPKLKYERDGGPSIQKIMTILENSNNAEENKKNFIKTCLFNDLIFNTDAHAKNFSIYIVKEGFTLTPMYDLLSAHFISDQSVERYEKLRGSLSVNGKYQFNDIRLEDWVKECKKNNFNEDMFNKICQDVDKSINSIEKFRNKIMSEVDERHLDLIITGLKKRWKYLNNA